MMAQNIYDDEEFFGGYSQLLRSKNGLDGSPEWPALQEMVGNVSALRVLDLGSGYGWFCRWAAAAGAQSVLGIDVSSKMIAQAEDWGRDPAIEYQLGDLDTVELKESAYDLVFSSLAFHYLTNLDGLFTKAYNSLSPTGRFVFSVEHPIYTAPVQASPGFQTDVDAPERKSWPLNSYANEGLRIRNWLKDGVRKQHRKIDTYVSSLLGAGFTLTGLIEWMPTLKHVEDHPEWKDELERPMFLLFAAEKK
jgi:SAM-dependent methyltransferase